MVGKRVLVVDDDIRNIFALTSLLERHKMEVVSATNGREAINILEKEQDVSFVLMDIMMPEMDGITNTGPSASTRNTSCSRLCIDGQSHEGRPRKMPRAGASDYIAKPVNTEQLLSLMRVWLHR